MNKAALSLLCCVLSSTVSASSWPSFRGPNASGVGADDVLPSSWNTTTGANVKWRTPIPGLSHASPIVWNDRIYVLAAVAAGSALDMTAQGVVFAKDTVRHEWRLHCLDRATGREQWVRVLHSATPTQPRHVRGTYANATPATDGRYIAAVLGNEGLFVLDMGGRLLWHEEMTPGQPGWSLDAASSPVIVDDAVIVQNDWTRDGFVAAYELASGRQRWRIARDEGLSWSTPGVVELGGVKQVVFNSSKWVRAHDPRDGREIWRLNNEAKGAWDRVPTPFAAGGLILVAGGGGERPMFALRTSATGDVSPGPRQQASEHIAWRTEKGSPYLPTPLFYRGLIYVCSSNGVVAVHRAHDGALVYQARLAADAGNFSASPVAAGGRVYFAGEDGDIFVVAAGEKFELLARNAMGAPNFATPAIADGLLIVRTSDAVHGIG